MDKFKLTTKFEFDICPRRRQQANMTGGEEHLPFRRTGFLRGSLQM